MYQAIQSSLLGFLFKSFVIAEFELRKLRHDFTELITRALQPALWLLIFGQVFAKSGAIKTGDLPYLDFIAPAFSLKVSSSLLSSLVSTSFGNATWESYRSFWLVQHLERLSCLARGCRLGFAACRKRSSFFRSRPFWE